MCILTMKMTHNLLLALVCVLRVLQTIVGVLAYSIEYLASMSLHWRIVDWMTNHSFFQDSGSEG